MKFLIDLFTGPDNKTWDLVRCGVGTGVVTLILAQFASILKGGAFDALQLGGGLAAIIGAGAAGMWARKDTELAPEHYAGKQPEHDKC